MAITLELPQEEEQNLRRRAEMAGQDVTAFLLRLAGLKGLPLLPSNEEREKLLDELADTAPTKAALLSDYDVSREGIYGDHD